jgi:cyclic pyranopterin phosphate synthase
MSKPSADSAGRIAYRGPSGAIYLNLTNRCSADCVFCLRAWADGVYGVSLVLDVEPETEEVLAALELEFLDGPAPEVVFCGFGEPTMRLDVVLAVTEWLRLRRLRSRLVTNGHGGLLNPDADVPATLARAGLDAVTVSLNAADPIAYDQICRPTFAKAHRAVVRFAEESVENGIATTLSIVDSPEADLGGCEAIGLRIGAAIRVRALVVPQAEVKGDMT